MSCEHDITDKEIACECDGLCPLCLVAKNEELRQKIKELEKDVEYYRQKYIKVLC